MTSSFQQEQKDPAQPDALLASGSARLRSLCLATGLAEQAEQARSLFESLVRSGSGEDTAKVGDGLSAFEFSVALGASPELTVVVALAAGEGPGAGALRAQLSELAQAHALDLKRFEAVEDLYFPDGRRPAFAARLAVTFAAGRAPRFELYLDPTVSGRTLAPLCVERTLVRSGFGAAWPIIGQRLTLRGPDADVLAYVVLDLSSPAPHVSVYARHMQCSIADLELAASGSRAHRAGDIAQVLGALGSGSDLSGLQPLTRYEFSSGSGARPNQSALEFPICGYAKSDREIEERVLRCLAELGLSSEAYAGTVKAMAEGPLERGLGLHSHIGFARSESGEPQVRVHFPVQVDLAIASPAPEPPASGVLEVVDRYESWDQITNHPFLHRLRSEPVSLHHIWNILANFQGSISKTFSQRLALIASRIDDPETRFIVTDLLYDEMGSGNYGHAHVNLFSNMMKIMEPYRPAVVDEWTMSAATRFNRSMDETYGSPDINVALGAIVSGEIFGKQFDQFLGDEIRRQSEVDPKLFVWVTLHEQLEVTHAGEGADIARLVPPEHLDSMARGAYGLSLGAWGFLTDVYEICYGERPQS